MIPLVSNVLFIAALMAIGLWLETINGKDGFIDEWLAPFPLGVSGGILLCAERAFG
jgi:hypothetical protein